MAFGDGVDEQGLRHIEDGREKGIPVKNIQYGIAACRTLAECRGLNAVGAAGVCGGNGGFFGLQQGGGLPVRTDGHDGVL